MKRTYKYRLYPTRKQAERLEWTLWRCRELYNAALQERRDAYRMAGQTINYYAQNVQLPGVKEERPEYRDVQSQVLQDVLRRVDKAFQAFFRRVKAGHTPGYPRFQGRGRYDSFTYPQMGAHGGAALDGDRLTLSKMGTFKIKLHRPIQGTIKTVTVKREGEHWYACFSCEVEMVPLPVTDTAIGIDLGLTHFAALSDGTFIDNPRYFRKGQASLATKQQALSRCKKGSNRRKKAKRQVSRAHRKVRNQRADFLHKHSRRLVNQYGVIVFEDLRPANMVKNHCLALSISDAGWGQFVQYCTYKAEYAGRSVLTVDPRYTSQTCSGCGQVRKKALSERWHSCECGTELDRDTNAALNILRLGRSPRSTFVAGRQSPRL